LIREGPAPNARRAFSALPSSTSGTRPEIEPRDMIGHPDADPSRAQLREPWTLARRDKAAAGAFGNTRHPAPSCEAQHTVQFLRRVHGRNSIEPGLFAEAGTWRRFGRHPAAFVDGLLNLSGFLLHCLIYHRRRDVSSPLTCKHARPPSNYFAVRWRNSVVKHAHHHLKPGLIVRNGQERSRAVKNSISVAPSIRSAPYDYAAGPSADSDEVARAFRDDVARRSDMMSPGSDASLAGNLWHSVVRLVNPWKRSGAHGSASRERARPHLAR
jgi:hypothetical protein